MLASVGCGHTEPFSSTPPATDQPFDARPPIRLTFNQGPDRGAAWLPDGSGILYSAQQLGRADHDVCLALIPPGGGSQRQLTCDLSPTGIDSTDAIESPAAGPDGRIAFVARASRIQAITPENTSIAVASFTNPTARTRAQIFPYTLPDGAQHSGASQLRWLTRDVLLYLAERVDYHHPCDRCVEWDTTTTGVDVVSLDLAQPGSPPERIPGTENASGASAGATADQIYYTFNGDSRVYRRTLSTGLVEVVHDFGPAGLTRDVHVVGNRMAAVVGGRVTYGLSPAFGPTQWDSGGVVHVIDLQSGADVTLDGPGLFRRPQLSPSGTRLVVETYPLIDSPTGTIVSRRSDLYLYQIP